MTSCIEQHHIEQFAALFARLDHHMQRAVRDFVRRPTDRNYCYFVGYIAACNNARLISLDDHNLLLAFCAGIVNEPGASDAMLELRAIVSTNAPRALLVGA